MTSTAAHQPQPAPRITTRDFVATTPVPDPRASSLPVESQAALRQFTLTRLTGYGVDPADASELHERVLAGQPWQEAATALAQRRTQHADDAPAPGEGPSQIADLRRASALVRMSQVMMLTDTPERRAIYEEATRLYARSAELSRDRQHVLVDTPVGVVAAWYLPATDPIGTAIVIGGVEGYSTDFDSIGEALVDRGVNALLVDGPGQGESRFNHQHYLTGAWREAFRAVIDHLEARAAQLPIAIIGNSMGGSFAMAVAVDDPRIRACCDNGGIPAPWMVPPSVGTFHTKMLAFCGDTSPEAATSVWSTVTPLATGPNTGYPLLVLHGGADPLVSREMAQAVFEHAPTHDKEMTIFSDGDHCLYNHKHDRDALIADWIRMRLSDDRPATAQES